MNKEYAVSGMFGFRHWSDSYGRLGDALRAAKELCREATGRTVMIMQKTPRPPHHEIGARWRPVAIVRQGDPRSVYREFAQICKKDEALEDYRVWPDGTAQAVADGAAYSWMSDDFTTVSARNEAHALKLAP